MDEYLEKIKLIAKKLLAEDKEWEQKLFSGHDVSEVMWNLEDDLEKVYFEAAKQSIKDVGSVDELNKKITKIIGSKALVSLYDEMEAMIVIFENVYVLNSISDATGYIRDCFDRCILRNDTDFADDYADYGFKSSAEMYNANKAMLRIVVNHTMMSYSLNSAKKEFKMISDLDDALCGFYAEKFDNCFDKLQTRLLVKTCTRLSDQMEDFFDALEETGEE